MIESRWKEIRSHGFFSPNGITTQKKKGGALVGEVLIIPSELFKMLSLTLFSR